MVDLSIVMLVHQRVVPQIGAVATVKSPNSPFCWQENPKILTTAEKKDTMGFSHVGTQSTMMGNDLGTLVDKRLIWV